MTNPMDLKRELARAIIELTMMKDPPLRLNNILIMSW